MKKIFLIFFFLSSCNLFIGLPLDESIVFLKDTPIFVSVDELDNGIIGYEKEIFRIENLNINSSKIELIDKHKDYSIDQIGYGYNQKGDFLIVYSRYIHYDDVQVASISVKPLENPFYTFRFSKNKSIENSKDAIFEESANNLNVFLSNDNDYYVYLLNEKRNNILAPELIKNQNNKITIISLNDEIVNKDATSKISLDEKGNGWSYSNYSEPNYIKSKIFSFKEYNINESKLSDELNNKDFIVYDIAMNYEGTGFILFKNIENTKIYLQKISNFNKVTEKEFLFDYKNLQGITYNRGKKLDDILINQDGKGLFFIKNDKNSFLYIKKIIDFKLENKETNLIKSANYKLYDYSINKKGNGLIILEDGKNFIAKKLRNYEIEKL